MLINHGSQNSHKLSEIKKKINASAREAISMLRIFADTSKVSEITQDKYKGEIAGEIEYPGELI